jgi:hypothetical protein
MVLELGNIERPAEPTELQNLTSMKDPPLEIEGGAPSVLY